MQTDNTGPIRARDVLLHPDHSVTDDKNEPLGNWLGIRELATQIVHYSIAIDGGPAFIVSITPDGQQIERPAKLHAK